MSIDQWLVQIFVKDSDDDWTIGTGYAIGNGLVLTAHHVVSFPNRHTIPQFTLVWKGQNQYEMPFTNEHIVFQNEQCDLALISYPKTTTFEPPQTALSNIELKATKPWSTGGFPKAGKITTTPNQQKLSEVSINRDSILISGIVQGIKEHGVIGLHTSVGVKLENNTSEKVWSGLSGSPVFIDGKLVAVITHEYKTLENYFLAISIPYLLETNPEFKAIVQPIDEETIKEHKQKLHNTIKSNITKLLKNNFSEDVLSEFLKSGNNKTIDELIELTFLGDGKNNLVSVLDSISVLTRILKKHPPKKTDDIAEISGWLLLNSVDPVWWFNNEQKMRQTTGKFSLQESEYIEVIISRSFLRPAQYMLDDTDSLGNPKPYNDTSNKLAFTIFDADAAATDYSLLIPVYKDLWESEPLPEHPVQNMVDRIIAAAQSKRRDRDGKLIYYLVTPAYLEMLEQKDWFQNAQEQLAGCLRFICCNDQAPHTEENPCTEKQLDVLAQLRGLLKELKNYP